MRDAESYDQLMALSNPALETFKGPKKTKGNFIPGKQLIAFLIPLLQLSHY